MSLDRGSLNGHGLTARAKGKLRGKPPKLTGRQQDHLVKLHDAGEHSIADLAEMFSVSRPTVYRTMR